MKILIDCSLIDSKERGMGIYLKKIIKTIKRFPQHQFYLVTDNHNGKLILEEIFLESKNISVKKYKINKVFYEQILIPFLCFLNKIDILISSGDTASILKTTKKQILIIHDVLYMKKNSFESKGNNFRRRLGRLYRKLCISISSKFSDSIITVSSFAKNDIQRELKIDRKRVHIIRNGVEKSLAVSQEEFIRKEKRILFVSGSDNQKNLKNVIEEFLKDDDIFLNFKSIEVVGVQHPEEIGLKKMEKVNFHGYLNHEELIKLYKLCSHFIIPSLYESFGIPAIEALHAGCKVYSSKLGALPEVLENNAVFFDPTNQKSIIEMLNDLNKNHQSYNFDDYLKSKEHSSKFTWDNSCEELYNFLSKQLPLKILVVGQGLIGSSFINTIASEEKYEIYSSSEKSNSKGFVNLFDTKVPKYFSGIGGLGNFWHSVLDLSSLNDYHFVNSGLVKKFIGHKKNIDQFQNLEFVPYFPIRPKHLFKGKKFYKKESTKLLKVLEDKKVQAIFSSKEMEIFDKVFICHGAFPKNDVLIDSKLAKASMFMSDHLIVQVNSHEKETPKEKIKFLNKGHVREYKVETFGGTSYKFSQRPIFENKGAFSHKDKAIYSKNLFSIIKKMILNFDFDLLKQSIYLRFGILFASKYWMTFVQFYCKDAYFFKDNELSINIDAIEREISKLNKNGLTVESSTIMSGIHFSNSYLSLSDDISVNRYDDSKPITLIGSNYNFECSEKHFTFNLMLEAEKIGKLLCQKV